MGDDEAAALFISLAITAAVLWIWYVPLFCVHRMFRSGIMRFLLAVLPPACAVIVWRTLLMPADPQVARDCDYLMLFVFAGVAWLIVPIVALPLLGISARADAVERNNWPAMIVALAATVSTTLVYAASNVGRGPTIWTTFGPATLGTVAMIFLWFIHRLLSPAWEDVAVGRDLSAGFRLGGMMLAGRDDHCPHRWPVTGCPHRQRSAISAHAHGRLFW